MGPRATGAGTGQAAVVATNGAENTCTRGVIEYRIVMKNKSYE